MHTVSCTSLESEYLQFYKRYIMILNKFEHNMVPAAELQKNTKTTFLNSLDNMFFHFD